MENVLYALRPAARNRINSAFMTSFFVGGVAGSALTSVGWGVTAVVRDPARGHALPGAVELRAGDAAQVAGVAELSVGQDVVISATRPYQPRARPRTGARRDHRGAAGRSGPDRTGPRRTEGRGPCALKDMGRQPAGDRFTGGLRLGCQAAY